MDDPLELALRSFSARIERLSRADEKAWVAAWTGIYCQPALRRVGRIPASRWVAFLSGTRSIEGIHAVEAYRNKVPDELVVLRTSERGGAFLIDAPTIFQPPGGMDVLILPGSMEWTMAFTHEALYGPYYAEASWCVDPM
jgi:hypothetical protein